MEAEASETEFLMGRARPLPTEPTPIRRREEIEAGLQTWGHPMMGDEMKPGHLPIILRAPDDLRWLLDENERLLAALRAICDAPIGPVTVEALEPWQALFAPLETARSLVAEYEERAE